MVQTRPRDNEPAGAVRRDGFPLTRATAGERLRITAHGLGRGVRRRLADLGLPVGVEIELVHRQRSGSVVVARGNARMALSAEVACGVLVAPAGAGGAVRLGAPHGGGGS